MINSQPTFKPITNFFRFILCIVPYFSLIYNPQLIYHITGPITITPSDKHNLIYLACIIQFIRIFYSFFLALVFKIFKFNANALKIFSNNIVKYLIIIVFKCSLMLSQQHRLKYYFHVFLIQLFILTCHVLIQIIQNQKVNQAAQIIFIDGFSRVAYFYEITRTFSPNFGLYYFCYNLLILTLSQLEGKDKKNVLYVKHDIYRIMTVTFVYMLLFSILQCSLSFFPLFLFLISGTFFFLSIKHFNQSPQKISLRYYLIVMCIHSAGQLTHLFVLDKESMPVL